LLFARNGNTAPILFIQTNTTNLALGDHLDSAQGLINSGYTAGNTPGNHFVTVNATAFATVDLSLFSAIFVPSDHGGTLTGNDLRALDNRAADIIAYLNNGGGLVAWAEDGDHQPATPGPEPQLFGFLPFLVSSTGLSRARPDLPLSAFGTSLGLTVADINNNFSHNFFPGTGGMTRSISMRPDVLFHWVLAARYRMSGLFPSPKPTRCCSPVLACLVSWRGAERRKTV
jgi:hypothetical protein